MMDTVVLRKVREAVEVLTGERGPGDQAALRRADIKQVETLIAELKKATGSGRVQSVTIPTLGAGQISDPPTRAEVEAVRQDTIALRNALVQLKAALS